MVAILLNSNIKQTMAIIIKTKKRTLMLLFILDFLDLKNILF